MAKAKLFMNGGSQAVRLPAEFRFDCDEINIRRNPVTGDVILSSRPFDTWDDYFRWAEKQDWPEGFLQDREQPVDDFVSPFEKLAQSRAKSRPQSRPKSEPRPRSRSTAKSKPNG